MYHLFSSKLVVKATFSTPKPDSPFKKVSFRPIHGEKFYYQVAILKDQKEFHENVSNDQVFELVEKYLIHFKQAHIYTKDELHHYLWNKKGAVTHLKKKLQQKLTVTEHNRQKNYLISDKEPVPFLIALGIQNADGSIKYDKRDKFLQINRFLDILLPCLEGCQNIVDFGCGKAYLTFGLSHLLQGKEVSIVGVDYKKDLLDELNFIATKLDFKNLNFEKGKIEDFKPEITPDAVISLHACNTATDEAILKAIQWGAKVIIAAPCCHQELYKQVSSEDLNPLLKHGILKERFAALATDAARAELLSIMGYKTDVIEFIDNEHTPKNLLIRAVKTDRPKRNTTNYKRFCESLNIRPHLETLLFGK